MCAVCHVSVDAPSETEAAEAVAGAVTLACKHTFHAACLKRWERRRADCPLCREPFQPFLNVGLRPTTRGASGAHSEDEEDEDEDEETETRAHAERMLGWPGLANDLRALEALRGPSTP